MCIFDKESLQDQYRPYLSQIDATDYEISNNYAGLSPSSKPLVNVVTTQNKNSSE